MARQRLGLLGGTFDPPHVGHLAAATEARAALDLDRVLLVVANDPWQKTAERELSAAADRLAMTEAACRGIEGIEPCAIEIERGGPSYTIDTLRRLSAPDLDLFLILGVDAAAGLPTWERHDELPGLATLVIVERAGDVPPAVDPAWNVVHLPLNRLDVSSSDLRRRVAAGRPLRPYVPEAVIAVVEERSLYGSARS
ncbi:MAG: nicotinate (nicotinamide) nucleotide adenylyltransferase [Acidimicrobiia bacterium]|nr:nicotinate (nicotinamide) nucleotide adenylyltransferase [Acidimicrobiia bacterium]